MQGGDEKHLKNRGAEQGDVDGPMEAALVLAEIATEARETIYKEQTAGNLPTAANDDEQTLTFKTASEAWLRQKEEWTPEDREQDRA